MDRMLLHFLHLVLHYDTCIEDSVITLMLLRIASSTQSLS
jgi:hypothetical protein